MSRKLPALLATVAAAALFAEIGVAQGKGPASGRQTGSARPQASQGVGEARQRAEDRVQDRSRADQSVPGEGQRERDETTTRERVRDMDDADSDGAGAAKRVRSETRERLEGDAPGQSAAPGSDTAREMRARAEERKEIQEQYRSEREPGQEGQVAREAEQGVKPKKPWWKFWGD